MALLVDGDVNHIEDLKGWDTNVLDVANGEGIDLSVKLRLAAKEMEEEIESFLRWHEEGELGQVETSTSLKRWHALKTLETVYRDAYFSQLNDRYGARWKNYTELAANQERRYFDAGVALVSQPVRRPARVEVVVGEGTAAAATYWLQATLIDAAGRESAPSEVQVTSSPLPHSLRVKIPFAPNGVTHWNLFAAQHAGSLGVQNSEPMAVEVEWVMPSEGITAGRPPGQGQAPDRLVSRPMQLRRG